MPAILFKRLAGFSIRSIASLHYPVKVAMTRELSPVIASDLIIIRHRTPRNRQWLQWRADILTDFLAHLYWEVKPVNRNLLVAIAPNIYDWAFQEYL
ncbi:MAG: hypothetical protein V7K95_31215 [Nostoc sp.]